MISEGVKIRAQIDSESVRYVMLANGGGSVALIALLPNVLRRKCSLVYENSEMSPPSGKSVLWINPKQPWVCWLSWRALYASIVAFLVGGALIVILGFSNIEELSNKPHNKSIQPTPSATAD